MKNWGMRQSNGHRLTVFGNAFDHGLTYAVGDQRSLLNNHLGYDVIVIPGAVGTSARHAAGSFAAVLGKPYVVDPRSWLFQLTPETRVDDRLQYSRLAKEHGDRLGAIVSARALSVRDLGDSALLEELVTTMLNYQGTLEASAGRQKITQWERMLGRQIRPASDRALPFALVPPYFSCKSALPSGSSDDHRWFEANVELARIATNLKVDHPLCPVICMSQEMLRAERSAVIDAYRDQNFDGFFVLIDKLNEHDASVNTLWCMKKFVSDLSTATGKPVMSLAGGYFALLLYHVGLTGICHGPGYGESRAISGSGAVTGSGGRLPLRYYVPALHRFYSISSVGHLLRALGSHFRCRCGLCQSGWSEGYFDVSLLDEDAIQDHFMSTRRLEVDQVLRLSLPELADRLPSTVHEARALSRPADPLRAVPRQVEHLVRWADALTDRVAEQ